MDTNIIRRDAEIRNFLELKSKGRDIAAEVAAEVIANHDIPTYFAELAEHGCDNDRQLV